MKILNFSVITLFLCSGAYASPVYAQDFPEWNELPITEITKQPIVDTKRRVKAGIGGSLETISRAYKPATAEVTAIVDIMGRGGVLLPQYCNDRPMHLLESSVQAKITGAPNTKIVTRSLVCSLEDGALTSVAIAEFITTKNPQPRKIKGLDLPTADANTAAYITVIGVDEKPVFRRMNKNSLQVVRWEVPSLPANEEGYIFDELARMQNVVESKNDRLNLGFSSAVVLDAPAAIAYTRVVPEVAIERKSQADVFAVAIGKITKANIYIRPDNRNNSVGVEVSNENATLFKVDTVNAPGREIIEIDFPVISKRGR